MYRALGIMTGTSCDGIDLAILRSDGEKQIILEESFMEEFSGDFAKSLRDFVNGGYAESNVIDYRKLEIEYTKQIAESVNRFLHKFGISKNDIDLLGFHGQTIFHDPENLITEQMGNAFLLQKLCGIKTVSNFRQKDVIYGGQGAPLVPLFQQNLFKGQNNIAIINIGGVANITYLNNDDVIAFDTGPGNLLIDKYVQKLFKEDYDKDGNYSFQGSVEQKIVQIMLEDKYFSKPIPKSLDKNYFNKYSNILDDLAKENMIPTLSYFTVSSIARSVKTELPQLPSVIYLTGGGRKNKFILEKLREELETEVKLIDEIISGDNMEAYAFAFLAIRSYVGLAITSPSITGIVEPITGGLLYK